MVDDGEAHAASHRKRFDSPPGLSSFGRNTICAIRRGRTLMGKGYRIAAVVATLMIVGTACSKKTNTSTGGGGTKKSSFLACEVTDTGGIDDRSFNASAWKGMQQAQSQLGIKVKFLQSGTQNDYAPNINAFIQQKCGIIVTVGFLMGDATKAAATAHTDQKFGIIDFAYSPPLANVRGLTFQTDQAAFLGGYLAAGMTKTGKVGTYGGENFSTVTIFENGFAAGILYYNKQKGTHVQLLGWNPAKQDGLFVGSFTDQDKGKAFANSLMDQGADIILPVAGQDGLGTAAAVQARGGNNSVIWVDTDGCVSAPQYCSLFMTSVTKQIAIAVDDTVTNAVKGTFQGGQNYLGTLANNGVAIAPFHDFASKIPSSLQSELNTVKQGIISGSISVNPKDYL
jgi:basic membrane protein A